MPWTQVLMDSVQRHLVYAISGFLQQPSSRAGSEYVSEMRTITDQTETRVRLMDWRAVGLHCTSPNH